jgi:hypothetical protein
MSAAGEQAAVFLFITWRAGMIPDFKAAVVWLKDHCITATLNPLSDRPSPSQRGRFHLGDIFPQGKKRRGNIIFDRPVISVSHV